MLWTVCQELLTTGSIHTAALLLSLGSLSCDEFVKRLLATMAPQAAPPASAAGGSSSPAKGYRDPSARSLEPGDATRLYYQFIDERSQVRFVERL